VRRYLQVAPGKKKHSVKIIQRLRIELQLLLGQHLGIGANCRIPQAALRAHPLDHRHRVRNRLVPIALLFPQHQKMLLLRTGSYRKQKAQGHPNRRQPHRPDPRQSKIPSSGRLDAHTSRITY
jgi:hypothetical protein